MQGVDEEVARLDVVADEIIDQAIDYARRIGQQSISIDMVNTALIGNPFLTSLMEAITPPFTTEELRTMMGSAFHLDDDVAPFITALVRRLLYATLPVEWQNEIRSRHIEDVMGRREYIVAKVMDILGQQLREADEELVSVGAADIAYVLSDHPFLGRIIHAIAEDVGLDSDDEPRDTMEIYEDIRGRLRNLRHELNRGNLYDRTELYDIMRQFLDDLAPITDELTS